jgi:hypothetical protein
MPKENTVMYEELPAEHKQKNDEIKALFEADLIGSFERTHHHGIRCGRGSHLKALSTMWIYLPLQRSAPELYARK